MRSRECLVAWARHSDKERLSCETCRTSSVALKTALEVIHEGLLCCERIFVELSTPCGSRPHLCDIKKETSSG